jgi:protease-4
MDLVPVASAEDPETPADPEAPQDWRVGRIYQAIGNTAIVSVVGIIDKGISAFEMDCYGGCDLDDIDRALALANNDPVIERVVLYIKSPGGSAIGVPETGARIADIRTRKEIVCRVDVMACSGGMWLASQCDRIDATQSAWLGSIGVYCAILDATRALEMEGYKVELIKNGKYKAMGAPFKKLEPEEKAIFEATNADIYEEFTAAVVSGRAAAGAEVSSDTMQGQSFRGRRAIENGLCDRLVNATLDEYVADLLSQN